MKSKHRHFQPMQGYKVAFYYVNCSEATCSLCHTPDQCQPLAAVVMNDKQGTWRIIYRIDADAIIILEVFQKKSNQTPRHIIETCQQRLKKYDLDIGN